MRQIQRMTLKVAICAGMCLLTSTRTAWAQPIAAHHTLYNTPAPQVIHVAIRAFNNPRGNILWVQTVGFQEYCADVLPNEWFPSWSADSLHAGALAVKMFAWYHHLHPVTIGGFTFDVDNTTNFETFRPLSGTPATDRAIQDIWPYAYTYADGGIAPLDYQAGWRGSANWSLFHSQRMSQWGSSYLSDNGFNYLRILGFYYTDRVLMAMPN
ncbi:MAG: hypothetical protein OWT28_10990 [Firmicutes bacterium]|nr:hypothetical protein [Bacillota bacterium]